MLISLKYFISEILSKLLHCVRTLEPKSSLFQPGRSSLILFRLFSSATTSAIDSPRLRAWSTPSSTSWVKIDPHSLPALRIAVEPSGFGLGLGLGCQIQNSSSPLQTARALSFTVFESSTCLWCSRTPHAARRDWPAANDICHGMISATGNKVAEHSMPMQCLSSVRARQESSSAYVITHGVAQVESASRGILVDLDLSSTHSSASDPPFPIWSWLWVL